MAIEPHQVETLIKSALPDCNVNAEDLTGTRDHYRVTVVSPSFSGLTLVKRHQAINEALREPLKGPLHALTIEAYTPEQWQQKQSETQAPRGIKL